MRFCLQVKTAAAGDLTRLNLEPGLRREKEGPHSQDERRLVAHELAVDEHVDDGDGRVDEGARCDQESEVGEQFINLRKQTGQEIIVLK